MKNFLFFTFIFFVLFNSSYSLDSLKLKLIYNLRTDLDPHDTIKDIDSTLKYSSGTELFKLDSQNIAAIFNSGNSTLVFKTTDGGYNWNLILKMGLKHNYGWLSSGEGFYVSYHVFLLTYMSDTLQRTTDGGQTWDTINTNLNSKLNYCDFLCNGTGIATGWDAVTNAYNTIFKTTDFGASWTKITTLPINYFAYNYPKIFNDSTFAFLTSTSNPNALFFTLTTNNGISWTYNSIADIDSNNNLTLYHPFFVDTLKGWVLGSTQDTSLYFSDKVYHTSDGGKTWVKQLNTIMPPYMPVLCISFVDSLNGLLTGPNKLYITHDGGKTWIHDTNTVIYDYSYNPELSIRNVYLTPKRFLLITASGKIYMYNEDGFNDIKIKETINENIPLNIYPNPAFTELNINLSNTISPLLSYQITDLLGKTVQFGFFKDEGSNNTLKINVEKLKTGVYFINLIYSDRKESGKFVKE